MKEIRFTKMSGAGNDFVVFDNRDGRIPELRAMFVRQVCERRLGIGADGVLVLEPSDRADFRMRYYNADGGEAEMCGNGGRCISRYAHLRGIASDTMSFETVAGIHRSQVIGEHVKLEMIDPSGAKLEFHMPLKDEELGAHFVNTGVPHVVAFVDDVDAVNVFDLGREIRYHSMFQPDGTNANFAQIVDPTHLRIRTYERGVEDETLACGTGTVAAALVGGLLGRLGSPIEAETRSGLILKVYFEIEEGALQNVFLEGDATVVFEGKLAGEAVTLP